LLNCQIQILAPPKGYLARPVGNRYI